MRICIIGAGAIGGVVAGVLAREGYDITLVTKHADTAEKINNSGIEVKGSCGDFTISIPAVAGPEHTIGCVVGMKYSKLKSSSLQSLERGRKTEVENYNGYVVAKGKECSISTPVNEQLTLMVREIEEGKRKITPDNFKEILVGL